jgi:hypothetical protein
LGVSTTRFRELLPAALLNSANPQPSLEGQNRVSGREGARSARCIRSRLVSEERAYLR